MRFGIGRVGLSILTSLTLLLASALPTLAADPHPAGTSTGNPALDSNIFYGDDPTSPNGQPPLVFVHGLSGIAQDWWTSQPVQGFNDSYVLANSLGYRTAFVTLNVNGQRGPGNDMWVNGQTLAQQLAAIAQHYGVPKVDVVAHSKGGVDAQTAIVYYGADKYVRNVFTLSSPFYGSELADLASTLSFDTANGLLNKAGLVLDDSIRTLAPSYMMQYRAQTDPLLQPLSVHWYCAAGTDAGPTNSPLRFLNQYLAQYGPNDSLVTVASACVASAAPLFIQPLHHFHMNVGHNYLPWVDSVLRGR